MTAGRFGKRIAWAMNKSCTRQSGKDSWTWSASSLLSIRFGFPVLITDGKARTSSSAEGKADDRNCYFARSSAGDCLIIVESHCCATPFLDPPLWYFLANK